VLCAMKNDLLNLASEVVAKALKRGATACDVVVVDRRDTQVSIRQGQTEKLEQAEARELGLRVFAGQSSALIAGSVLTYDAIERLIDRCFEMAKLAPADPHSGLAAPEQLAIGSVDLDLISADYPSAATLKTMAQEAEQAALSIQGVSRSNGAGASSSDATVGLAASNGFVRSYRRTGFSLSASVIGGEGLAMERDYDGTSANHFSDLEAAAKIGRTAGERVVRRLNPRKIASQSAPVIFDRRVASSLLGHLSGAINGASIARGVSFLKGDLGAQIFKKSITIVDDPLRLRGPSSRSFDGEGLPTHTRNLIEKGVLTSWVMDLRASRQLGLTPTGHGGRGLASQPSASTSNLHLEAGSISPEDMMKTVGKGLLVTEFIGSSINSATGDYSRGASGFWFEHGEIQYPVSEITIAGNLRDMFLSLSPCNDLVFKGSTNAPSCLIEGMTLAGR
jgi:PmbA protein